MKSKGRGQGHKESSEPERGFLNSQDWLTLTIRLYFIYAAFRALSKIMPNTNFYENAAAWSWQNLVLSPTHDRKCNPDPFTRASGTGCELPASRLRSAHPRRSLQGAMTQGYKERQGSPPPHRENRFGTLSSVSYWRRK